MQNYKKYKIIEQTFKTEFPFNVQIWYKTEGKYTYSGEGKFFKTKKEALNFIKKSKS